MGVSFEVAKAGTRYRPKLPPQIDDKDGDNGTVTDSQQRNGEGDSAMVRHMVSDNANALVKCETPSVSEDLEVSFALNLFRNGFSVGEATEMFHDAPKQLHSYDRASETLFSAIEYGSLPGDIFDDIPCKYVNGALLCEIRDYRNCLSQKAGSAFASENSPKVHRVLLHMCMENVVKDISSFSDDSWTYKDLLEVESRVLKVMQPDLHLDPEPLLSSFCGEPLRRKLNLGIAWRWKRRNISNASATNLTFSRHHNVTPIPDTKVTQNHISQSSLAHQDKGFMPLQQSTSIPTFQKNHSRPEILSQSNPFTSGSNFQIKDSCNQSLPTIKSDLVPPTNNRFSSFQTNPRKTTSSTLDERGRCEKEAIKGPRLKKVKQEPMELFQQQLWGSQAENILAPESHWWKHQSHKSIEAAKVLHQIFEKNHTSELKNNARQPNFEVIPKLSAGVHTFTVKQETVETDCSPSEVRKIKDKCFGMENSKQSNFHQLSSPLNAHTPPSHSRKSQTDKRCMKNMRNKIVSQPRKVLKNPQVSAGVCFESLCPCDVESSPKESVLRKQTNIRGSDLKIFDSLNSTSNKTAANSIIPKLENLPLTHPSEIEGDHLRTRLLKIQGVTKRYGLNIKKRKLDTLLRTKPVFHTTPPVSLHLLNGNNDRKSEDATTDRIPWSTCFLDRAFPLAKTRTLTFVRPYPFHQGNQIPIIDREAQIKLVMLEKFDDSEVEACVLYGHKERINSIDVPLPNFPSTHLADVFAAQFTSLMLREGYHLDSSQKKPHSFNTGCSSSSQEPSIKRIAVERSSPTLLPHSSSFMLSPTGSMSTVNSGQLPWQHSLPASHISHGNIQSTQTLQASYPSKSQLDSAAQANPALLQRQQFLSKHNNVQHHIHQRQTQLFQRREMMGSGAGSGSIVMQQLGPIHRFGNSNFGPFGSITDMRSSVPVSQGGHVPWIGNLGSVNGLGTNGLGFNTNNQQQSRRVEISQQRQTLQQLVEMRSTFQSSETVSLVELLSSAPSQVNSYNFEYEMSPFQLNPRSPFQQMDTRSLVVGATSPESSSQTHGSVGSTNADSMKFSSY